MFAPIIVSAWNRPEPVSNAYYAEYVSSKNLMSSAELNALLEGV